MPFNLVINHPTIATNSRLIFPISMGQHYHTGAWLAALVKLARQYNSTLLIADALQRHNLEGNEAKAINLGTTFLAKHNDLLSGAIIINDAQTWENNKDLPQLKIVRWKVWGAIQSEHLAQALQRVNEEYNKQGDLLRAIHQTTYQALSAVNEASSIVYQKEEIAYLLTFDDFSNHVYPKPLNASQQIAAKIFASSANIPHLITPTKVNKLASTANHQHTLFKDNLKKRHDNSLPLAARLLVEHAEKILSSPEVSPHHKKVTITQLITLIRSHEDALQSSVMANPQ